MFTELLNNPQGRVRPPELQATAARDFSSLVNKSNLKLASENFPIGDESFALIGVASYSPLELEMLDEVDSRFDQWKSSGCVYVFDIASFKRHADLQEFLATACLDSDYGAACSLPQQFEQTPILVLVKSRKLIAFQQGLECTRNVLKTWGAL
jgi:hypothetical protein